MKSLKKVLAIFLATVMALGVMSVSAFAEDEFETVEGTLVSFVGITVESPVEGYYADCIYELDSDEYELVDMKWANAETGDLIYSTLLDDEVVDETFAAGTVYTVTIALYAADGYVFGLDSEELTVSVNGYVAEDFEVSELGKVLIVNFDFECEADGSDIGGDDDTSTGVTFDQIIELLKSVVLTIIRFFGSLFGIG